MISAIHAPVRLSADIQLPASKSMSNRALIIGHLAGNHDIPKNLSNCEDTEVMLHALSTPSYTIDVHAAGTAMRFLTAYFAIKRGRYVVTGSPRLCQRPIRELVNALRCLGAHITYEDNEGYPPLRIEGEELNGGEITLPAGVSSQFISALLIIGPKLKKGLTLHLTGDIVSRPYIDMTLKMMQRFCASAKWISPLTLHVDNTPYKPSTVCIESDWSAASFWYEIMALCPDEKAEIRLVGLKEDSVQGDEKAMDFFAPLGVSTTLAQDGTILHKTATNNETCYLQDLSQQPDLAPAIVVTCAMLNRPFLISGLHNLRIKECDRMAALTTELKKFGVSLSMTEDTLSWNGKTDQNFRFDTDTSVETYDDHRIAMAFAPCAFRHDGFAIKRHDAVGKSYPGFWEDLKHAGFNFSISDDWQGNTKQAEVIPKR